MLSAAVRRVLPGAVAVVALLLIGVSVRHLEAAARGLDVRTLRVGDTPVTVFRPTASAAPPAPVVLIAHGFAGSQQLMQPFALTLARNGFIAVTFDFPGHGRHPQPMRGGLDDTDASLRTLLAAMGRMGDFAAALSRQQGGDGRYAVVGHSMASDIVVRHAQAQAAQVQATVGVSLFAPTITADTPPDRPRNLLVVSGALEPAMMAREALRVAGAGRPEAARLDTPTGRFDDGTARLATLSPGVEHIAVLYSPHTLSQTLAWLRAAAGLPPVARPFLDARGPALGGLLLGVVALAWPLSRGLAWWAGGARPRPADPPSPPRARWWRWRGQAPATLLPAVLTPLVLWKLPTDGLPIVLGDYLVAHFALYGALTLAFLWARGARPRWPGAAGAAGLAALTLPVAAYAVFAVGLPVDRYVFNVQPDAVRLGVALALFAGALPYFVADEALTRDPAAARGAYLAGKAAFLGSLVLAIALNPGRLFFLAIIVPAILLMFVIYGLFSRWVWRATGHAMPAAVANALAFSGFMAAAFPLVR